MDQIIIWNENNGAEVINRLNALHIKKVFLVCGSTVINIIRENLLTVLEQHVYVVLFQDFQPNPTYDSVVQGVSLFRKEQCDLILAIGGGSAIDVAKCIKLFSTLDPTKNYLHQELIPNDIPLWAVPTTAGTGSEATRFSVIYYKGEKQSVSADSSIPSVVVMEPLLLQGLPEYQRKVTMLDALCHAMESMWSVNAIKESRQVAQKAITIIFENAKGYLSNTPEGNRKMLEAANYAGRAINITQTTACHAMSYKLTSLYGIAHGHAVALCMLAVLPYTVEHQEECVEACTPEFVREGLLQIACGMGCEPLEPEQAVETMVRRFTSFFYDLKLQIPSAEKKDLVILTNAVNVQRLKNHPVVLTADVISSLYESILF